MLTEKKVLSAAKKWLEKKHHVRFAEHYTSIILNGGWEEYNALSSEAREWFKSCNCGTYTVYALVIPDRFIQITYKEDKLKSEGIL